MKLTFYMQAGYKGEFLNQNETCHCFYYMSILKSDYIYNRKNNSVNVHRLRKTINYDLIGPSDMR